MITSLHFREMRSVGKQTAESQFLDFFLIQRKLHMFKVIPVCKMTPACCVNVSKNISFSAQVPCKRRVLCIKLCVRSVIIYWSILQITPRIRYPQQKVYCVWQEKCDKICSSSKISWRENILVINRIKAPVG